MFHNLNSIIIKIIFLLFASLLFSCQIKEPTKIHGINFLENRSAKLVLNISNKNDTLRIIGQPHTKSINNEDEWFYIERTITKGEFHKLGQHVLKENNLLFLSFDKYGILKKKEFLNKNNLNKISFDSEETKNEMTRRSFIEKFLSSIKNKMYRNR